MTLLEAETIQCCIPCHVGFMKLKDKYWEKRCKAAEKYIEEDPCDPDIFPEQRVAYQAWQTIKAKGC